MKLAQAFQASGVLVLIDVKTSRRYSTFTSSDTIHRVSPNPGIVGSQKADNRVK